MKRAAFTLGMILMMLPAFAAAQQLGPADHIVTNVPFQFMVGNKMVPAGQCIVDRVNPATAFLQIQNPEAKVSVRFLTLAEDAKTKKDGYALVFHKYGDYYFLTGIRVDGNLIERLPEGKAEKELRASGAPQEETNIAALR